MLFRYASLTNDNNSDATVLSFKKLSENAFTPVKLYHTDPAFALFSAYNYLLPPHGKLWIKFDLQMHILENFYATVIERPISSLIYSMVVWDVILTSHDRQNLGDVIFNLSRNSVILNKGE